MPPVTIIDVRPATKTPGMWIVTDSAYVKYATKDMLLASAADRYRILGRSVQMDSASGFYYRQLRGIEPVKQMAKATLERPTIQETVPDEPQCPKFGARCIWRRVLPHTLQCQRPTCRAVKRADDRYGYI